MIEELTNLITEQAVPLIHHNAEHIAAALLEAEDGKLTVGMSFKLTKTTGKLYSNGAVSFARRWKDETEGGVEIEDRDQLKMPLVAAADE